MKFLKGELCFFILISVTHLFAQTPGTLDNTFNSTGVSITPVGTQDDHGQAIAVQPDGKIIVAGRVFDNTNTNERFGVARFNTNGSLDNTFGTIGRTTTLIGSFCDPHAVIVQPDGKIILAGNANVNTYSHFALVRYKTNGTLDSTFGINGIVTTQVGVWSDSKAYSLLLQPDGKIVAAGTSDNGATKTFAMVRYLTNGTLDNSFGTSGKVLTAVGSQDDAINAIALQADGKIVATGFTENSGNNNRKMATVRYSTNGILDPSFGSAGKVITVIGTNDMANAIKIQPDKKIIIAGYTNASVGNNAAMVRFDTLGVLDATFGNSGVAILSGGGISSMVLQPDGKIVTVKSNGASTVLVRYSSTGSVDNSFISTASSGTFFSDIALQSDGKIVAAGEYFNTNWNVDFVVARYHSGLSVSMEDANDFFSRTLLYPNPFISGNLTVEYILQKEENVSMDIFNVEGKSVENIIKYQLRSAGNNKEQISLSELDSGIYFIRLNTETYSRNLKLIVNN